MPRFVVGSIVAILLFSTLARAEDFNARVTKVDLDRKTVVVDRGDRYQALSIVNVLLFDKNGKPLQLSDVPKYGKGAKVRITFEKDGKKTILTRVKFLGNKNQ